MGQYYSQSALGFNILEFVQSYTQELDLLIFYFSI